MSQHLPRIEPFETDDHTMGFTLSGVNVSLANALRRTILTDIPLVIFRTTPYEKNKCTIHSNTSRLNNEIIKQRLSCIPIHIKDVTEFPLKNYIMEVQVENTTDTIMIVTSEQFTIKDVTTGALLPLDKIREIFPADDITGHFIDFVRLRPRISDEIPGEKIHLTCEFDIGNADEDGMYNAVSTCSYGFTPDVGRQDVELAKKMQQWKDEGKSEKDIKFEADNWKLLEAKRIFKKDSYDFIIETVGIYTNQEIMDIGCKLLIARLHNLDSIIEKDQLEIKNAPSTMANSFDIILENEDYTIGKVLEYFLFSKFYEARGETKTDDPGDLASRDMLTYCGFKKMHPHDKFSVIRVAYSNAVEKSTIKGHLKECIADSVEIYTKLKKDFSKL